MHPTYVSAQPGDCPICNMKLVPIPENPDATKASPPNSASVPERTAIALSAERRQLIGLRSSVVERRNLRQVLRSTGVVEHDETRLTRIAPRFGGWIRRLHVNYTGQSVEQGQPLLTVYSPEVMATESEYLLARRQLTETADRPDAAISPDNRGLLAAARRRLELWGVGDAEIQELERRGQPGEDLLLRAPVSGHVITKTAVEGLAFVAGQTLYELGDLTNLWVRASLFEYELPLVHPGQTARVTFPYLDGLSQTSSVAFIYPHVDALTRRAEARIPLLNPREQLRPAMWVNVEFDVDLGERLVVPASALIDTGTRWIAFVLADDDHLEPREVEVGVRTDDAYEVRRGLAEDEHVVTRALFLVDAESQLKAAIAAMSAEPADLHRHSPETP